MSEKIPCGNTPDGTLDSHEHWCDVAHAKVQHNVCCMCSLNPAKDRMQPIPVAMVISSIAEKHMQNWKPCGNCGG